MSYAVLKLINQELGGLRASGVIKQVNYFQHWLYLSWWLGNQSVPLDYMPTSPLDLMLAWKRSSAHCHPQNDLFPKLTWKNIFKNVSDPCLQIEIVESKKELLTMNIH